MRVSLVDRGRGAPVSPCRPFCCRIGRPPPPIGLHEKVATMGAWAQIQGISGEEKTA